MLIKDIEKEGFVQFEEEDKNIEVSQEKYDQIIESAYINQLKYNNGKIDSRLKEKYDNLKNRTKKVNIIEDISIIIDATLGRREFSKELNTFVVVEDSNGMCLSYNITTGEDHSFDYSKELIIYKDKSSIINLYEYKKEDIQDVINIGYMNKIIYYKDVELINSISNHSIVKSNFLEFSDRLGNKFYLDCLSKNIYVRKNSFKLLKTEKTKENVIFEKGKQMTYTNQF